MRSLCCYYNNTINEVPVPGTAPVWCSLGDILSEQPASFILFFFPSWGEKINKWQSNTVYANLISHASYVLPRLLGSAQLRLWGKWQCRGLIWVISSVMIMRLSTPFVASTKGHMNKRRFEVQVQMIRGDSLGHPSSPQPHGADTLKHVLLPRQSLAVWERVDCTIWKSSVGEVCYCIAVMYESF